MTETQPGGFDVVWRARIERAYLQHREAIIANLKHFHSMGAIEDAMHGVFARWLARIPSSAAVAEVMLQPAYLFTCVRKEIHDEIIVQNRRRHLASRAVDRGALASRAETPRGGDPAHAVEPALSDEQLTEELARLPENQSDALRSFAAENVRSRDAARTLGCGEGALFVRRHRALAEIREHRAECELAARLESRRKQAGEGGGGRVTASPSQLGIAS